MSPPRTGDRGRGARTADAAVGLRVKTARAVAVIVTGSVEAPHVVAREVLQLWDPEVPDSRQPYHAALGLPEPKATEVVRRARAAVEAASARAAQRLGETLEQAGYRLCGVGLVVGSDRDPTKLGNPHVRAHAREGRLYADVLGEAMAGLGAPHLVLVEREAWKEAGTRLGRPAETLKRAVAELGRALGPPWRADEKSAAVAAWVALSASSRQA